MKIQVIQLEGASINEGMAVNNFHCRVAMIEVVNWFCAPRTVVAMVLRSLRYASLKDMQSFTGVGLRDDLSQAEKKSAVPLGVANSDSEPSDHQSVQVQVRIGFCILIFF